MKRSPIKRKSPLKRSGYLKRRGKKVTAWENLRAKLKKQFFKNNIVRCEICGSSEMLSFSHRRKRRFITDENELAMVALFCLVHHDQIERLSHSEMFKTVTEIIEKRNLL